MSAKFTKTMARNMFYGGGLFFFLIFVGLVYDTTRSQPERDHRENITEQVALGKRLWDKNDCVGCHTLLGEGAYFAPELGNVYKRRGGAFIKAWIKAMPTNAEGRRQMPNFNLTDEELDALVAFFKWTSEMDTSNWPPNIEG